MDARIAVAVLISMLALAPAALAAEVPLVQGFESGAEDWSTSGQWHLQPQPHTVAVSPAINPALVTLPDAGLLPPAAQDATSAWFGEPATGTYCGTAFASVRQTPKDGCTSVAPQSGRLVSPSFSLAGRSQAWVEFDSWWEIEARDADGADQMRVEVSDDGGASWTTSRVLNPADPPWGGGHQQAGNDGPRSSGSWQRVRANISSAAGSANVRIRFAFDTVDARRNGFRGWLVDGVAIVDAASNPIKGDVTTGFADPGTPVLTLREAVSQPTGDGGQQVTFKVDVSPPSAKPIKVDYGVDDAAPRRVGQGTIAFTPGATTFTETLTIPAGATPPLTVALYNPQNAVLGGATTRPAAGGAGTLGGALDATDAGAQLVLGVRQESATRPQLGQTVVISHVSGELRYRLPAGRYVPLAAGQSRLVPVGTVVDARRGHVRLVVENGEGQPLQQGEFWDGIFGIFQATERRATTELRLGGGDFAPCAQGARKRRARGSAGRVVRTLWGKSGGRFRTKGRFASATVRGTEWETADLCLATRITVREGSVVARDFRRRSSRIVRAGEVATISALQTARYRKRTGLNAPRISRR